MREIRTSDLFVMSRIITKMNVKNDLKLVLEDVQNKKVEDINIIEVGLNIIMPILSGASSREVEKEIYAFAGDILCMTPEEVSKMNPLKLIETFKNAENANEWKDFFSKALKLIFRN